MEEDLPILILQLELHLELVEELLEEEVNGDEVFVVLDFVDGDTLLRLHDMLFDLREVIEHSGEVESPVYFEVDSQDLFLALVQEGELLLDFLDESLHRLVDIAIEFLLRNLEVKRRENELLALLEDVQRDALLFLLGRLLQSLVFEVGGVFAGLVRLLDDLVVNEIIDQDFGMD